MAKDTKDLVKWTETTVAKTLHVAQCPYCNFEAYDIGCNNTTGSKVPTEIEIRHEQRLFAEMECEAHISWKHCPANNCGPHQFEALDEVNADGASVRRCKLCGGRTGSLGLVLGQDYE